MKNSKASKKKLIKVPNIKPDLWIEVDSDISDQDLKMKIDKILENKKLADENIKISKQYKHSQDHTWQYKRYTGPIYSLLDIKGNIRK